MAKYFEISFEILKVVKAPRVIRSCLPTSTISMSFVGLESRSTRFPASLAAWVPVFIATNRPPVSRSRISLSFAAGAGPGRRRGGDEHRNPGGQGGGKSRRSRLQSDDAQRVRRGRLASADDPGRLDDLQYLKCYLVVFRHSPGRGCRRL